MQCGDWCVFTQSACPHDHHRVMPAASVRAAGHVLAHAHFLIIMIYIYISNSFHNQDNSCMYVYMIYMHAHIIYVHRDRSRSIAKSIATHASSAIYIINVQNPNEDAYEAIYIDSVRNSQLIVLQLHMHACAGHSNWQTDLISQVCMQGLG